MSMSGTAPIVYLLEGEDEYGIAQFLAKMGEKLGDPGMAEVNTTRLDGRNATLEQIEGAARTAPFLTARRLVILSYPTARLKSAAQQKKFVGLLNNLPPTTALALVEYGYLTSERDRRQGKVHWLERWAREAGEQVFVRQFHLPSGEAMVRWIRERAISAGGQFTPHAATALANLVGDEPRLAEQEIHKLLTYVNYARPVEAADVDALTPLSARVGDFALLNALRSHDRRQAQSLLHRMLDEGDALAIFQGIVSQLRDLLLVRELLDEHQNDKKEIAQILKIHAYRAELAIEHARRFSIGELESIYRRLLELDESIKTGRLSGELALDLLVIELTS